MIDRRGADSGELARELDGRAGGVERHGDQPGAERREVGLDEVPVVAADDRDPVAGLETQPGEAGAIAGRPGRAGCRRWWSSRG